MESLTVGWCSSSADGCRTYHWCFLVTSGCHYLSFCRATPLLDKGTTLTMGTKLYLSFRSLFLTFSLVVRRSLPSKTDTIPPTKFQAESQVRDVVKSLFLRRGKISVIQNVGGHVLSLPKALIITYQLCKKTEW